ncbi:hypothetical protein RYX36_031395 [Vicia faba]
MDNALKNKSKVITFSYFDVDRQTNPQIVRALVVDNDDHFRKIHEDILKTLGVETRLVETGQKVSEIISYDWIYDLILIRRFLSVINGAKTCQKNRYQAFFHTIMAQSISYPDPPINMVLFIKLKENESEIDTLGFGS